MKESILRYIKKCPKCGVTYIPQAEDCDCTEEPKVSDWEDIQDVSLLSKWQAGEVTL